MKRDNATMMPRLQDLRFLLRILYELFATINYWCEFCYSVTTDDFVVLIWPPILLKLPFCARYEFPVYSIGWEKVNASPKGRALHRRSRVLHVRAPRFNNLIEYSYSFSKSSFSSQCGTDRRQSRANVDKVETCLMIANYCFWVKRESLE